MITETLSVKSAKSCELPRGIRRRGKAIVVYLTHPDGRAERRSLGNVTVKLAEKLRAKFQLEITEGKYVKPAPRADLVSFKSIADAMVAHSKLHKRAWDGDEQRAKVFVEWWGAMPAAELTPVMIAEKLNANLAPNGLKWSKATFNEYRNSLSHAYKLAIDRGEAAFNPASKVTQFKLENARTRELSRDEEARLRAAIEELHPSKMPELDLLLHTGARCSNLYGSFKTGRVEMAPLQWAAVNLDWNIVTFPRSKSGRGYQIPLNAIAQVAMEELLKRAPDKSGAVIRKKSGLPLQSGRKWFENCCVKAGIVDLRVHDLRHTFATRLRRNRVPLEDIAALLGHDLRKHSMTARYAHVDLEVLREAVATLVPKPMEQTSTKTDTGSVVVFQKAAG
jgi:integrase